MICKKCGIDKPEDNFYRCRWKYRHSNCKLCFNIVSKKRTEANREYIKKQKAERYQNTPKEVRMRWKLLQRYGLTLLDYEKMLVDQGGVCKICKQKCSSKKRLSVDHCHETALVRGLLCDNCNNMIGRAKDSSDTLRLAAEYLDFFKQVAL